MTQEDKKLLLKELCERLPYGVMVQPAGSAVAHKVIGYDKGLVRVDIDVRYDLENVKLYLRPLSSMTEEEKKELSERYVWKINGSWIEIKYHSDGYWDNDIYCPTEEYLWLFNWLNKHHFDYRGLIEKSLAIAVTEDNNPYKK